jgi:hypothetical protein
MINIKNILLGVTNPGILLFLLHAWIRVHVSFFPYSSTYKKSNRSVVSVLFLTGFLFSVHFDLEDGGNTFYFYQTTRRHYPEEDAPKITLCFDSGVLSIGISAMGGVLSYFWGREPNGDPQLDIPDPKTGLTPRERQAVIDTWAIVKSDAKRTGVELFIRSVQCYMHGLLYCIM